MKKGTLPSLCLLIAALACPAPTLAAPYKTASVEAKSVSVKKSENVSSADLTKLFQGQEVIVIEIKGDTAKVKLKDGRLGYIKTNLLSLKSPKPKTATRSAQPESAAKLISQAKSKLGANYSYGSSGPDRFDCSGFVSYTYKAATGISLPRVSGEQSRAGSYVAKSDLEPGDIIGFDTSGGNNNISHVGIYIGNGEFIHASSGTARKVIISSLDSGYYAKAYMCATRVLR